MDTLITFECFPFHSPKLPKKEALIKNLDEFLSNYRDALKQYLVSKSIVYVSAIGTKASISRKEIEKNSWLRWVMDLIGMGFMNAKIYPLANKGDKITSALLLDKRESGLYKGITLI